MAVKTTKRLSHLDGFQTQKSAFNEVDSSYTQSGYLTPMVGRKIECVISQTNVPNDTETFTFSELGVQLYVVQIIYTDADREIMLSAERIA